MKSKSIQQYIGLWEAWIEFDPVSENAFGTFYLFGEAEVSTSSRRPLFVKEKDPHIPGRLNLYLQGAKSERLSEVVYCEPVSSLQQYRSVAVYHEGELIAEIKEIEIMV